MNAPMPPVVLASGGTGGHMFPAEALAVELDARDRATVLITDVRGAGFSGDAATTPVYRIAARSPGVGIASKAKGAASLCRGWLQARRLLARIGPAAVVGFGGYPSVPTVFAATRAAIPTLIHEQNAVLGRANAALAPRVDVIATSFASVSGIRPDDARKIVHTGNPVRQTEADLGNAAYSRPAADTLLMIGGSQGARVLSDVVPAAIARLPERTRSCLKIVQQARPEDCERVGEAYRRLFIDAEISPFFEDLADRMQAATLVIARAGASTIAELMAIGRPAILVPYRYATDGHQLANARALEQKGAAWVIEEEAFTAEALSERLGALLADDDSLARTARAVRAMAMPVAAALLADQVERIVLHRGDAGRSKAA